ncbi:MAG TPA: hypothetical protein VEF04_12725, partial [Blastocatellia bacterium]|nr:hypothetical protein [Blastocatellia bacterium]
MKVETSNQSSYVRHKTASAKFSLRAVTLLEVLSVASSIFITAWVITPLQLRQRWIESIPGILALLLMINSHRWHGETPQMLGFTTRHFFRAIKLLILPMIITTATVVSIGYFFGSLNFKERFWTSLVILPFWGLTQQYILQAFIYRRLKLVLVDPLDPENKQRQRTLIAIMLAAGIFAFVHLPNGPLMLLTLIGGLV